MGRLADAGGRRYAYGGAAAVSLIIIVQLVPAIFIAPYLGAITDRARAGHVLFIGLLVMGVSMAALAVVIALEAPPCSSSSSRRS